MWNLFIHPLLLVDKINLVVLIVWSLYSNFEYFEYIILSYYLSKNPSEDWQWLLHSIVYFPLYQWKPKYLFFSFLEFCPFHYRIDHIFLLYINSSNIATVVPGEINYSVRLQICRFKGSPSFNIILKGIYFSASREDRVLVLFSSILSVLCFVMPKGDIMILTRKKDTNFKSLCFGWMKSEVIEPGGKEGQ